MKRILLSLILFASIVASAQNTMYFMDRLPQNIAFNPAIMPKMKFYFGLPAVGGINAQIYNSGFTYNQMEDFTNNLNNPNYNPDDFVKSIGDYNKFTGEASMNLMSFGFRIKEKNYLSFSVVLNSLIINKAASDIAYIVADLDNLYPEDFPIIVDDIYLKGNAYMNFGVTYSRIINEHLTLGITPRISFNQAGLNTSGLYYKVDYTEPEPGVTEYKQTFVGEMQVGLPTPINPDAVDNGEFVPDAGLLPENWQEDITLNRILKDKSMMVDIGATYQLDKWNFSASLLNLGSTVFSTDAYLLNGDNEKVLVKSTDKIKIGIPVKLYVGAMRQFSPKWNYALLFNNNFYNTGSVASATASLNGYIGNLLSASVSYTAGYKYDNLGIGLRLRFLPETDLYFVTDNIIQAFNYKNAYRLTAAVGINIAIGVKMEEKTPENLPPDQEIK